MSTRFIMFLIVLAAISAPIVYSVKKFTDYDTSTNFSVKFNPVECYQCKDCPCEFTLNNGKTYTLNSKDKNECITDSEAINKGVRNRSEDIKVEFDVKSYSKFFDCVRWYSAHPTLR